MLRIAYGFACAYDWKEAGAVGLKGHMAEVLRLDRQTELKWLEMMGASALIALPIVIGLLAGRLPMGLAVATGAMLASNVTRYASVRVQVEESALLLLSLLLSCLVGIWISRVGVWGDVALWSVTTLAALVGNFDRIVAIVSGRFIVFVVILTEMARHAHHPRAMVVLVMMGGAMAVGLMPMLATGASSAGVSASHIGLREKAGRWVRSFRSLSSCQFPIRLSVVMAVTLAMDARWPDRHVLWAALTVALLCKRQLEPVPIRASQRALGASLGVLLSCVFLFRVPSGGVFILFLAGLSAASMVARKQNDMLYSMVATPLIMILVGGGKSPGESMLVDRLVATILGAILLVLVNIIVAGMIRTYEKKDSLPDRS